MVRILLIEDDSTIAAGLAYSLEQEGWSVTCKGTLAQGRNALETGEYQLLLVDVGLPDGSGYDLCAAAKSRNIPVIFATARGDEGSVVLGLDMGADDYIVKPFSIDELGARVSAHLRRERRQREYAKVRFDDKLAIDYTEHSLYYNGEQIPLAKKEFDIIELLSQHIGQVFSKERIYELVWDYDSEGDSSVIAEHIRRIRSKFAKAGMKPYIETVWGVGYKWVK